MHYFRDRRLQYYKKRTPKIFFYHMRNSYESASKAKDALNERWSNSNIRLMQGNTLSRNKVVYGQYLWCNKKCGFSLTLEFNESSECGECHFDEKSRQLIEKLDANMKHNCEFYRKRKSHGNFIENLFEVDRNLIISNGRT